MTIDDKLVQEIAYLARLRFEGQEAEDIKDEMSKILSWMEKLKEIDTSEVEPLIHMSAEVNVLREDKVGKMLDHEAGLKNAPKRDTNYIRVPKVIE